MASSTCLVIDLNGPQRLAKLFFTLGAAGVRKLVVRVLIGALIATQVNAQTPGDSILTEPYNTGWSFYMDNDILAIRGTDQQYTGGFAVTLSGRRAREYWYSLDPILGQLNHLTGFESTPGAVDRQVQLHAIEFGLTLFTPDDISRKDPIFDDHPYGSLMFLSNTRQRILPSQGTSYESLFTLGVLGAGIGGATQKYIHDALGQDVPQGWDNQISDGGELTFKYTLVRQDRLASKSNSGNTHYELSSALSGSVGYVTEISADISGRWGRISTPWWSFTPDYSEYINLGSPVARDRRGSERKEFYVWAGLTLRYRLYNALLQGQFRDSAVTFDRDELNELLAELSVGVTREFESGLHMSFTIRARTPELDDSDGLPPVWGGLIISRAL